MELIKALQDFDGKRTGVLEQLDASLPRDDSSATQLLEIAKHPNTNLQVAATWILKRWSEDGDPHIEDAAASLVELLKNAVHWEVRLHLLQMLSRTRIPSTSLSILKKELQCLMADKNKLVRAWSIGVYVAAADQNDALRAGAIAILEKTDLDEAASVRARIRQIRKRYKWTTNLKHTKQ